MTQGWVNGGFFVMEPEIFDFEDDNTVLEQSPLESIANAGELMAFFHKDSGSVWTQLEIINTLNLYGRKPPLENMVANTEEFTPFISVIMNCYNGEKYLKEAIDSIYSQTYQNWKLFLGQ